MSFETLASRRWADIGLMHHPTAYVRRIVVTHTAVVLRYYLDYDDAVVAESMNMSVSGVRSNISRALATLRVTPDILLLKEDH